MRNDYFVTLLLMTTSAEKIQFKNSLRQWGLAIIEQRIATAREAADNAQQAANQEEKSSAGDKYETGRSMAQLEIEKNTVQLHEFARMKQELERISITVKGEQAQKGSLVYTSLGAYFLALSAGKITIDGEIYFAVSLQSPIGSVLLGAKEKDEIHFNGKR